MGDAVGPKRFRPVAPPERIVTWCHDCEGKGARWAPRTARLQALPALAAQMQGCDTCDGSGRLPGVQPPV
jgi:DnaJ-class molecular chaperone